MQACVDGILGKTALPIFQLITNREVVANVKDAAISNRRNADEVVARGRQ